MASERPSILGKASSLSAGAQSNFKLVGGCQGRLNPAGKSNSSAEPSWIITPQLPSKKYYATCPTWPPLWPTPLCYSFCLSSPALSHIRRTRLKGRDRLRKSSLHAVLLGLALLVNCPHADTLRPRLYSCHYSWNRTHPAHQSQHGLEGRPWPKPLGQRALRPERANASKMKIVCRKEQTDLPPVTNLPFVLLLMSKMPGSHMWQRNCPVCQKPLEKKHPTETVCCPCGKYVWKGQLAPLFR